MPTACGCVISNGDKGVRFDGDAGWIHLQRRGRITAEPKTILPDVGAPVDLGVHGRTRAELPGLHQVPAADRLASRTGPPGPHDRPLRQHLPAPGPEVAVGSRRPSASSATNRPTACSTHHAAAVAGLNGVMSHVDRCTANFGVVPSSPERVPHRPTSFGRGCGDRVESERERLFIHECDFYD